MFKNLLSKFLTSNIYKNGSLKENLETVLDTAKKDDENIHFVEFKNVLGKKGWLYGDADGFAFEFGQLCFSF